MGDEFVRAQDRIGKFDTLFSLSNGAIVGVNKRRLYETPFFLLTDQPNNDVSMAGNGTSDASTMRVSGEGPMQLTQMGAVQDGSHGNCTVRLYMTDGSQQVPLSNVPLHINTIFGPGGQMYPLPEGLYTDEDRALVAEFIDLTGESNKARICLVGAKYSQLQADPVMQRVKQRLQASEFLSTPQWYGINDGVVSLTAYQQLQFTIQINGAHNFEIHQLSSVQTGDYSIDIVDNAKQQSIINAPNNADYAVPASLWIGNGSYPYRFHEPILTMGGQTLLVTLTDLSGAPNTIYLTLGGVALKVRMWS